MTVDLYRTSAAPLNEEKLFEWHRMVTSGRRDLTDIGRYRTFDEPMQIISGAIGESKVRFQAPPCSRLPLEMTCFIDWFNGSAPTAKAALPALTSAGIAHLYFESIHPFEDGNGRIGRAIAEKSLGQSLDQPVILASATSILARRKSYYEALEATSDHNEITDWLAWFAGIALEAQQRTLALSDFLIDKTKLLDRLKDALNERQLKAILRMFHEGPEGFKGGLSAADYASITGASPSTVTRDLADLVEKGALIRTGDLRHARYHKTIPLRPIKRITITSARDIAES